MPIIIVVESTVNFFATSWLTELPKKDHLKVDFLENLWFEIDENLLCFHISFSKKFFNKKLTFKISSAACTGKYGKYMNRLASLGFLWWQHISKSLARAVSSSEVYGI